METTTIHPVMPLLRQAERTLANTIAGGLDQLTAGSEEISELILRLQEDGMEQIAAALQRSLAAEDRTQRANSLLRAYKALTIVRSRLADGLSANLADAPLLSEESRLHIPPLPANTDPETLSGALALMKASEPLHRMYAAERVTRWGAEAVPGLLALALEKKNSTAIRRTAARSIAQIDAPAAQDALVKLADVLDLWREVSAGLIRRGQTVVPALESALGNPSADGAWLMAKVLWRLGAHEALRNAYKVASTPKPAKIELAVDEKAAKGKGAKPKKQTAPKAPEISTAFEAYHQALGLNQEQVTKAIETKANYYNSGYVQPTMRAIFVLLGVERGWASEDDLINILDDQQRNEIRISLRHVYGTPSHGPVLAHYTRMLPLATKYKDKDRARIGIYTLDDANLDMEIDESADEDEEEEE
jgi:hypothetical protein